MIPREILKRDLPEAISLVEVETGQDLGEGEKVVRFEREDRRIVTAQRTSEGIQFRHYWIQWAPSRCYQDDGSTEYKLIDNDGWISIEEPNFDQAEIERIIIKNEDGSTEDLRAKGEYKETLTDQHTKTVFQIGNRTYNDLRTLIRAELKAKHRATEEGIPSKFLPQ